LIQSVLTIKTVSMQPNFTFKKSNNSRLRSAFLVLGMFLSTTLLTFAQTTVSTTGFLNNNANALVTFNFKNNNTYGVVVTGMSSIANAAGNLNVKAYYKTSAINGAPGAIDAANGWIEFANQNITGVLNTTTTTTQPFLSNTSLVVPAGATYGIVLEAVVNGTTTAALRYSTVAAGVYTFSGGGCDVITGTNIGYGGIAAPGAPTFSPRAFMGSVTFTQALACSGTPAPGNTLSSVTSVCPGVNFNLSLQNAPALTGISYQWQSSSNGTTWTNVSGATNATLTTSQTAATYYRCQVTCSGNTGTSTPVLVALSPSSSCYCLRVQLAQLLRKFRM